MSISSTISGFKISFVAVAFCVVAVLISGCSDGKDRGDGFRSTKTEPTTSTTLSKTPTLKQPCSLISAQTAASILGLDTNNLGEPESSTPEVGTLRCRYNSTSEDKKLFLTLNIYVYEKQVSYDLVEQVNNGKKIETSVDDGFYYIKTTKLQSERFVGARNGKNRIGVSASIAIINPGEELTSEQTVLPEIDVIATQVGLILSKV